MIQSLTVTSDSSINYHIQTVLNKFYTITTPITFHIQIAMSSVGEHMKENSSPWHVWLRNKLSGVRHLSDDMVRELFVSLQEQEIMGATSKRDVTHNGTRKQDRKSALNMTKFLNVRSLKTGEFIIMTLQNDIYSDVYVTR